MAHEPAPHPSSGISRRRLLGAAGVAAGGIAIGGVGVGVVQAVRHDGSSDARASEDDGPGPATVPFYGEHQAGIATAAQDRMLFAAFDIVAGDIEQVQTLLRQWTVAADRLSRGEPVADPAASDYAPPPDTGEATGLHPARLTLTFGVGPGLFEAADGSDRFGLAAKRPAPLVDLPTFPRQELDESRSGGDLCVQACGDDPQVLFHAIRNLTRIGRGVVVLRWSQEGFGRTSSTTSGQTTPRNLMGFKDGTNNIHAEQTDFDSIVWADAADDPAWMAGGSYLVARRIRIRIEVWDRSSLLDQETTIGRVRDSGAPLGQSNEFDAVDLDATGPDGTPVIGPDAHVRVASQQATGISILRRGYNFTDGVDQRTGQLDAGLFFISYQRDPRTQFIPLQTQLSASDALNEYIQHVGSAVFAILPGVQEGGSLGDSLFA
jgi:deferrochelatase/peroxidase EfeB